MTDRPMGNVVYGWLRGLLPVLVLLSLLSAAPLPTAAAGTVTVTTPMDTDNACATTGTGACSLRDAVRYGNAHSGTSITVPAGQFILRDRDTSKGDELSGDLDIKTDMTISGAGAGQTTIDASGRDRVLEVYGAALGQPLPNVLIRGVTFANGLEGYDSGAGIRNKGRLELIGCDVRNNRLDPSQAAGGTLAGTGGISNAGILQVDGGVIEGNVSGNITSGASPTVGGIGNDIGATTTINNAIIRGNSSPSGAGGIANLSGTLTINSSTIVGNTGGPGGIANQLSGGLPKTSAVLTITNSTISGNSSTVAGALSAQGITTLVHVTIAGNSTGIVAFDPVMIRNSIIANSIAGDNCFSSSGIDSQGFNLDSGTSCGFLDGGADMAGKDPMLALLADNGGGTLTHALLPGSPAIDAIPLAACVIDHDQRGKDRPSPPGGSCDIGAFEVVSTGGGGTPPLTGGLQFFPLSAPVRLLDTRPGQTAVVHPNTPLSPNAPQSLPGQFTAGGVTVPAGAQALVGNATVDNTVGAPAGFATLYPSGSTLPLASNLNFVPGTVRPNAFTVGLGGDGKFNLLSNTGGNFIIDITGYYAPPGTGGLFFHPLSAPVRLLDTRPGQSAFKAPGAALTAGQTLNVPGQFITGGITVPTSARALAGNATVDNNANAPAGFATLFPGGTSLPPTSNLNFAPGTVAPNAFTVGLGGDGSFNLYSSTGGNFILDVTGYYDAIGAGGFVFYPLAQPVRELDTRPGQAAFKAPAAPLAAKGTLNLPGSFTFSGVTVPNTAKALVGNATVDNTINAPDGFATLYPGGAALPLASNLNYTKGTVAPNAFIVGVGADGTYNLYSLSGGNFILDISGYFAAGTGTSGVATAPHS